MAIATGNAVKFIYVAGNSLPATVNDSTIYFLAGSKELYVGRVPIADYTGEIPTAVSDLTNDLDFLSEHLGSQNANRSVITDSSGDITTRYLVDGYHIVNSLPTSNIDQNAIYLIASSIDDTGGGGDVSTLTYRISRSGNTITLTGSDGSTSSVDGGLTSTEVQTLIDTTINNVLGRAY